MRTRAALSVAGLAAGTVLSATTIGASAEEPTSRTIVVTGDIGAENMAGSVLFNRDPSTSTPFEFTTDEASTGNGSVFVAPIGADNPRDKFIAEFFTLSDASEFESFSYDFQIAGNGTIADADDFYLNVYTNNPGVPADNFYTCRFDYVPVLGSTEDFVTFEVTPQTIPSRVQARGGATCPATLGGLEEGSTIRVFAVNVGGTSASDAGLAGYLDNVVLANGGTTTTYDLEASPQTKDDCKNGGFASFGFSNQGQCVSALASAGKSGKK